MSSILWPPAVDPALSIASSRFTSFHIRKSANLIL
jgi:hypothetical protein